jgi:hypothetical protein
MNTPRVFGSCPLPQASKFVTALSRHGIGFYTTEVEYSYPPQNVREVEAVRKAGEDACMVGPNIVVKRAAFALEASSLLKFLQSEPVKAVRKKCRDHEEKEKGRAAELFTSSTVVVPIRGGINEQLALNTLEASTSKALAGNAQPWPGSALPQGQSASNERAR